MAACRTISALLALLVLVLGIQGRNFYIIALRQSDDPDIVLPNIQAVTTFDPFHHKDFSLRLTGPGYNTLPLFYLNNGYLSTNVLDQYWCVSEQDCVYTVQDPTDGAAIKLSSTVQSTLTISINEHSLLVANDQMEWAACQSELGYETVSVAVLSSPLDTDHEPDCLEELLM